MLIFFTKKIVFDLRSSVFYDNFFDYYVQLHHRNVSLRSLRINEKKFFVVFLKHNKTSAQHKRPPYNSYTSQDER